MLLDDVVPVEVEVAGLRHVALAADRLVSQLVRDDPALSDEAACRLQALAFLLGSWGSDR